MAYGLRHRAGGTTVLATIYLEGLGVFPFRIAGRLLAFMPIGQILGTVIPPIYSNPFLSPVERPKSAVSVPLPSLSPLHADSPQRSQGL